ncbi:thermonuclease family protein [Pseudorhodoferax sp.]|uniref:thermonuclease family protein n=1 Tax=Pseudorhodoferax sp. TaxID=1993553 RepID=UPI002DD63CB9|nr:thermonuclease family protein [Pseudorhodoferax sp.]
MSRSCVLLLCAALVLSSAPARAAEVWLGTVSHVSDGDTLWVRPGDGGKPRKIRVHGIDAPELCQAHGPEARAALQQRALHHQVRVQSLHADDYGRLLARLWLGDEDLAALQVREGHAWSYRYRHNPGPYLGEEGEARAARRGLFADAQAQRPYAFRQRHGPCSE